MKNMKVSKKLIVSFLVVAALAAAVGIAGIIGMLNMDSASSIMYGHTEPLSYMSKAIESLQRMRVNLREYVIAASYGQMDQVESIHTSVEEYDKIMTENLDKYAVTIKDPTAIEIFNEARGLYDTNFKECLQKVYDLAKTGDSDAAYTAIAFYTANVNKIVEGFDKCMSMKVDVVSAQNDGIDSLTRTLLTVIICILVVAVAASMSLAFYLSGIISKPLKSMASTFTQIGLQGDLKLAPDTGKYAAECAERKDEIGDCSKGALSLIQHLLEVDKDLSRVSDGDLTVDVKLLSERDTIGKSVLKMIENLNSMFGEIHSSTEQVSTGSKQIADGAQALAQGSTEQAAAVEQLSSSITEIAEKTKSNAKMADRAANLANTIMLSAEKGSRQMDAMMVAVNGINDANQNINKVIKVIDDIAFQTNILALNAAVEAARAGQHGKGFAVVAEEVRSLAAKSAEAAKETGDMIANSIEKAELGVRIADETSASLSEIVSGIIESNQLIGEIARSSEEQSLGISQINIGIDQVAQVVQQNSATAEESAAASEEMSGQSGMLQHLVVQFKLKNSGMFRGLQNLLIETGAPVKRAAFSAKSVYTSGVDYGKY